MLAKDQPKFDQKGVQKATDLRAKLVRVAAGGIIVLTMVFSFAGIVPHYFQLKDRSIDQVKHQLELQELSILEMVHHFSDVAYQIGSRTKARDKLEEYNRGEVSLEELQEFSRPIIYDALKQSDSVLGIIRLDSSGKPVVNVGRGARAPISIREASSDKGPDFEGPMQLGDFTLIVVRTQIRNRQSIKVGSDIVVFDAKNLDRLIGEKNGAGGQTALGILDGERFVPYKFLYSGFTREDIVFNAETGWSISEGEHLIAASIKIPDTPWILLRYAEESVLNAKVIKQLMPLLLTFFVLIVLSVLLVLFVAKPLTGQILLHTDELHQRIEEQTQEADHARDLAEKANEAKSHFLSRMSHELRTPLNSILGFTQLLSLSVKQNPNKQHVDRILSAGRHLLDLVNEVLDITTIESGKLSFSMESIQLKESVLEVIELLDSQAKASQIRVSIDDHSDSESMIIADRQRLKQVLLNLGSNGIKYNRELGTLVFSWSGEQDGFIRLSVTDTGEGIPVEKQKRLFSPFDRLDAEKTVAEGTGLGLALTKRLIEGMGGQIGLDSQVGKGTTFWVELKSGVAPQDDTAPFISEQI